MWKNIRGKNTEQKKNVWVRWIETEGENFNCLGCDAMQYVKYVHTENGVKMCLRNVSNNVSGYMVTIKE